MISMLLRVLPWCVWKDGDGLFADYVVMRWATGIGGDYPDHALWVSLGSYWPWVRVRWLTF